MKGERKGLALTVHRFKSAGFVWPNKKSAFIQNEKQTLTVMMNRVMRIARLVAVAIVVMLAVVMIAAIMMVSVMMRR